MNRVLVVAEHDGSNLNASTSRCVSCARMIDNAMIDVAVFSDQGRSLAAQAAALDHVNKVLIVEREENHHQLAALLTPQVIAITDNYTHLFAPGTTFGRDLMPRVAATLGVAQVTDIMNVVSERTFERPIYAGNAIIRVEVPEGLVVATVRAASFKPVGNAGAAIVEKRDVNIALPSHTRFISQKSGSESDRPDLQSAQRVVSGGRGVGNRENFELIYRVADKMGAAVGASRAAVDAGYVANDLQVGQTGKIISPEFYIAFGISGAIQHLAGIKDAGVIVAVNSDPDAPIFEIADIGLVGDLNKVIPELLDALT